jgi:tetratricopeptide (TPR) repeat protein
VRQWCLRTLPLLGAAALLGSSSPARAQLAGTGVVLDRYLRGDFDAAVAQAAAPTDFDAVLEALKRDAPAWIDAGGAAAAARRRLAAATFAIEVARAAEHVDWKWVQVVALDTGSISGLKSPDFIYWKAPPRIIEWGCALLRTAGPPTAAERLWHLAAIAVAQRRGDYEFLIGSPWDARANPEDAIEHLKHATDRFPDEPRLLLAQAVAIDWRTWYTQPRRPRHRAREVPEARPAFENLVGDAAVGAEAMVRLGALRLRSRDFNGAVELFERVETATRDRYLLYLARYFTGQARGQQQRLDDAERAYRGALAVIPRATSATTALAALLARLDRRAEATAIVEAALTGGPPPVDPWRTFAAADDRFWPEIIARLRAQIHR